jgi:hypothetical protein
MVENLKILHLKNFMKKMALSMNLQLLKLHNKMELLKGKIDHFKK